MSLLRKNSFQKSLHQLLNWFFLSLFVFLLGCTGKVNTETSIASAVESMAAQNSVTLISNSTQSQNKCEIGNKVVLQVALSSIAKYFCRDKSSLMDSVKLGPLCSGGISIQALSVDGAAKDCHELTICGKRADSTIDITERIDGTAVQQLTFNNLPWGCEGRIEASLSDQFNTGDVQKVTFQVLPPSCPFCEASNGVTCNSCASSTNMIFVAGQLIPGTCNGGCKQCAFPPPNSPTAKLPGVNVTLVDHANIRAFYSTANAVCGQSCTQVQQLRVCNDGQWVSGDDIRFPTQCQEPPSQNCSAKPNVMSQFLNEVSGGLVKSVSNVGVTRVSMAAASLVTCSQCQAGQCEVCKTAGGADGYKLYSQATVSSGMSCSSVSQCQACVNGLFQGDPTFKYGACSVLSSPCTQKKLAAPVSSGSSQIFYNGGACDPISLQCLDGVWKESSGASVSQTLADTYTLDCVKVLDCKTAAGISILNGASQSVFNTNTVDSTDSCYTAAHYKYLSCANGSVSPSDPGSTFSFKSCTTKTCVDPRDSAKTISAGSTVSFWSVSAPDCSALPNPQSYCDNNKITITCPVTGGTATVSPASASNLSTFKNTTCEVPPSCSGCVFNKTDAANISLAFDGTITLFKMASSDLCQSVGKLFKCKQGLTGAAPSLVDATGGTERDSVYPYLNCSPTGGADQGNLGGTGGGTGNDNGPGSALKKRFGGGDGSGGGSPCMDATKCNASYALASQPFKVMFNPCLLPWPNRIGEIEFYGSIIAFSANGLSIANGTTDTVCVKKPDTCSNHRQSRTCHYPKWTGSDEYKYPNCVEKASCP